MCHDFCTLAQLQGQQRIFLNTCCIFDILKSYISVLCFLHTLHVITSIIIVCVCICVFVIINSEEFPSQNSRFLILSPLVSLGYLQSLPSLSFDYRIHFPNFSLNQSSFKIFIDPRYCYFLRLLYTEKTLKYICISY